MSGLLRRLLGQTYESAAGTPDSVKGMLLDKAMEHAPQEKRGMAEALQDMGLFWGPILKQAFQLSQYSTPLGPPQFRQTSQVPPFRGGNLTKVDQADPQKVAGNLLAPKALTPAARLAASSRVGTGAGVAVKGPSIAEVSKPSDFLSSTTRSSGFGSAMPGAKKGGRI